MSSQNQAKRNGVLSDIQEIWKQLSVALDPEAKARRRAAEREKASFHDGFRKIDIACLELQTREALSLKHGHDNCRRMHASGKRDGAATQVTEAFRQACLQTVEDLGCIRTDRAKLIGDLGIHWRAYASRTPALYWQAMRLNEQMQEAQLATDEMENAFVEDLRSAGVMPPEHTAITATDIKIMRPLKLLGPRGRSFSNNCQGIS
jgi:hypothetical protein